MWNTITNLATKNMRYILYNNNIKIYIIIIIMGIYTDGNIYGVSWTIYDELFDEKTRFERIYSVKTTITMSQIQEIKEEYEKLSEDERRTAIYRVYTSVSDTYGDCYEPYMSWWTVNKKTLEELFLNGYAHI